MDLLRVSLGGISAIQPAPLMSQQMIELLDQVEEPGMIFLSSDLVTQGKHAVSLVRSHVKWGADI